MANSISRWGNSLAIRLPRAALDAADLHEGDTVTVSAEAGNLVVRRETSIDIDALIDSITVETLPESFDFPPVGRELI
jgi:antitoxin MazE